jgi:hypothetical protein
VNAGIQLKQLFTGCRNESGMMKYIREVKIIYIEIGSKEPLINSEVPSGIRRYRHFSNRQLFEKWSKVKVASFALRALKSPGWTYSELPS